MTPAIFLCSILNDPNMDKLGQAAEAVKLIALLILGAGILAGISALALGLRMYFRSGIEKYDRIVETRSGTLQFFIGALNGLIVLFVVTILSKLGPLALVGLLILFLASIFALFGYAARLRELGLSILALGNGETSELKACLVGTLLLVAVFLIPFIGQIFWLGFVLQCFGTALLRFFSRSAPEPAADLTAPIRFE